ncbi:MAG: class I SAM-dependent methyltransferase [Candidatus Gribaldobacteria bacterium]|nr:class I SAM-dependent methyltransferase [Candidatus Gribaldobacteria bacterium]
MTLFIFFLLLIILVLAGTAAYAGWRAAPWAPTFKADTERFLKLANIKPGQKIYDLGCGDGRLVVAAGEAGAVAIGFEISLLPYSIAKWRILSSPFKKKCSIKFRDFWRADLSNADIVYFFLMPKIFTKIKNKLEKELKPGAKVIIYAWPMDGWTALATDCPIGKTPIYLYQI